MSITSKSVRRGSKFHPQAYQFVFSALRHTQEQLGKVRRREPESEEAHISGPELLQGVRDLAIQQFGLLTLTVFHTWGVHNTEDFGRIVFDLIDRGEMRKTDRDSLSDFYEVYDFEEVFDRDYQFNAEAAFRHS
jgi:uncharacterized repeat protein (TIGR04138 family)